MRIVSLDPGVTTGWAVLDDFGEILDTGNLQPEDVADGLDYVLSTWGGAICVVEKFPIGPSGWLADTLREVVSTITQVLEKHGMRPVHYTPGEWKTSTVRSSPLKHRGERTTLHQRDAIRMGRYHLRGMDRRTGQ